jgi:hypothetical protein
MAVVVYACRWVARAEDDHDTQVPPAETLAAPQENLPLPASQTGARG